MSIKGSSSSAFGIQSESTIVGYWNVDSNRAASRGWSCSSDLRYYPYEDHAFSNRTESNPEIQVALLPTMLPYFDHLYILSSLGSASPTRPWQIQAMLSQKRWVAFQPDGFGISPLILIVIRRIWTSELYNDGPAAESFTRAASLPSMSPEASSRDKRLPSLALEFFWR